MLFMAAMHAWSRQALADIVASVFGIHLFLMLMAECRHLNTQTRMQAATFTDLATELVKYAHGAPTSALMGTQLQH